MSTTIFLFAAVCVAEPVLLDRPVPKLATGAAFREELQRDISASWENIELRSVLSRLQAERRVAVLLDCRVDPNAVYRVRFTGEPLREALATLARQADAAASFSEQVVYIGPEESARWLATSIEQAEVLLADKSLGLTERRQFELSSRKTVHWQDLTTPREILDQIAAQHRITIDNLDVVPHDLWASATLPQVSVTEALTLVLIQLDLGWKWEQGGECVRLVPWQPPPLIERRYQPRRAKSLAEAERIWSEALPEALVRRDGEELVVTGRSEDHHLAQILRTTGTLPKPVATKAAPVPLRRRLFTLKLERIPVKSVMLELEKSGVEFVYDAAALEKAGISLDQPVVLDARRVDADTFFKSLFTPVGLEFEIDDRKVTLRPAR